ncbi:MAG: hypothetical protein AAF389_01535 [Gemmatimonadota bacterium]
MNDSVYRPSRAFGWFAVIVWLVAAAVLFGLGFILEPSDREAMDGFQRLFFTIVPIKPFAWVMSIVFVALGVSTGRRAFSGRPTLRLTEDALHTRDGDHFAWEDVAEVEIVKGPVLKVSLHRLHDAPRQLKLGPFELGTSPEEVAAEVDRRRGREIPPADQA